MRRPRRALSSRFEPRSAVGWQAATSTPSRASCCASYERLAPHRTGPGRLRPSRARDARARLYRAGLRGEDVEDHSRPRTADDAGDSRTLRPRGHEGRAVSMTDPTLSQLYGGLLILASDLIQHLGIIALT